MTFGPAQELAGLMTEDDRRSEENAYLAPALKFDEAAHEQLMAEARQMDAVLKGEQVHTLLCCLSSPQPL